MNFQETGRIGRWEDWRTLNLDLKINGVPLEPGSRVNSAKLLENGFHKQSLLRRIVKRQQAEGEILQAENCETDCFGEAFSLFPCTHGYLNRDRQWQTRATVHLVDGRVRRVTFHVLNGIYAAPNYMDKFQDLCTRLLGEPGEKGAEGALLWKNDKLKLVGRLQPDRICADFEIEFEE